MCHVSLTKISFKIYLFIFLKSPRAFIETEKQSYKEKQQKKEENKTNKEEKVQIEQNLKEEPSISKQLHHPAREIKANVK